MNPVSPCLLVTGASGGIGGAVVDALAQRGARLVLLTRRPDDVRPLLARVLAQGGTARVLVADLVSHDPRSIATAAVEAFGGLDGVIHCAGVQMFGQAAEDAADRVAHQFEINLIAPVKLTQALLPHLQTRPVAHVALVGSIFGSIAFPCFASSSASKFGLRGYAEALRRELADGPVRVHYVAPRYTRTALNHGAVARMAEALHMKQDHPEWVARQILAAIDRNAADTYLGWPERFFVRLNALFPRLVDRALIRQARAMRPFLRECASEPGLSGTGEPVCAK